jgi:hypothetical protein
MEKLENKTFIKSFFYYPLSKISDSFEIKWMMN